MMGYGLALPREARELSRLNNLHEGLGLEPVIGFHSVSAAAPKPKRPLLRQLHIPTGWRSPHPIDLQPDCYERQRQARNSRKIERK